MTRLRLLLRVVVSLVAAALVLGSCSFDPYKLPLPGGPDVGDDPITVTAQFRDVLDLVPDSTVKVNDVSVGKITDVRLQGYHALVTMKLRNDTELPDNAVATIQQTSLLGEKFVQLAAPDDPSPNRLRTGDVITMDRTGQNPEVEEVLGALSLLLNGGGVGQLQTITRELNKTLHGREGDARSVLHQIKVFSGQLDRHKHDIVTALEALNRLSGQLNHQRDTIDATLDELPGALQSINSQRHDLVRMLSSLAHLSGVATRVIRLSKDATIDTLRQLNPVLSQLQASGQNFVNAFQVALTYPFVDEVVGRDPQVARNLQMGDYTNLSIKLDISLDQDGSLPIPTGLPTQLPSLPTGLPTDLPTSEITKILGDVTKCLQSGDITSNACRKVLGDPQELLQLIAKCKKKKRDDNPVCQALEALPSLPTKGPLPSISLPTGLLPSVLGGAWHARRQPDGVRTARADHAAAVADVRPGAGRPARPGAGDEPMITRRTKVQLAIFALITMLGVSFVGAKYAQLNRLFYSTSYTVVAHFQDSGGMYAGGLVSYRGVRVGQVDKLVLTHDGVDAYLDDRARLGRQDPRGHPRRRRQPLRGRASSTSTSSRSRTTAPSCTTARRSRWPTPAPRSRPRSCWATSRTPSSR